jgi:hypothetical protein
VIDLNYLTKIVIIKSRRFYMGGLEETHTSFWWEDLKGGGPDAGIDGRIILEWLL